MEGKILALVAPRAAGPAAAPVPDPTGVPPDALESGSRQAARWGDHDDDEWMLLARNGRPGAFDALVRRHQGRALAMAHRYLGQPDLAKDVAQNTFLEIYRRLDTYRADGKFRAYFHRVLLNQCRMAARSRRTRTRFHERLADALPEELARMPDEQILARERERQVERGLLCLSDKLRAVVVLAFSAGLSYGEIADALDIKVGTVKSRLSAALVTLRAELGEERS